MRSRRAGLTYLLVATFLSVTLGHVHLAGADATFTIVNLDAPREGFNDPTPVSPVGGNTGTTLGEQRLIALQYAAYIWGAELDSDPEIRMAANFDSLDCDPNSAVLAQGGLDYVERDVLGAIVPR